MIMPYESNKLGVKLASKSDARQISISRGAKGYMHQSLDISFQRTVRVSDNADVNHLPPGLGVFPLQAVADYEATMPRSMLSKGGYFFPMYRKYQPSHQHSRQRETAES